MAAPSPLIRKIMDTLNNLMLYDCENLQNIDGLKDLKFLTNLNLSWCSRLQNVDALKGLPALTYRTLLLLLTSLLPLTAHAHNALFAITPHENKAGGLFFHITSKPLPDGGAQFRVVITENQAKFEKYPLAELGILKSTQSARSIDSGRKVPFTRKGQTLVCVFTVSQKELADPNFCFFFTNLQHALDDKFLWLLTKDFVFARLNAFAPHRP